MLTNKEQKFAFVHIPKTAGTSLRRVLTGSLGSDISMHYPIWIIGTRRMAEYFTFAFVRNPWERLLSLHAWGELHGGLEGIPFKNWLLDERLHWWLPNELIKNKHKVWEPHQLRNMCWWITDKRGNIAVDFIGRIETFEKDLDVLRERISIPPVPHVNTTEHKHYREVYDDEMREFVEHHHKRDIEMFNYSF